MVAGELCAKEEIEVGESGELVRFHILLGRDHRRQLQPRGGTSDLAFVMVDDIDAIEEHRLDRGLPRPHAQRIIGKRGIIGVEHKRGRSEEHTSELQSLMRTSYAVFCLKKKKINKTYQATREYIYTI